EWMEGGRDRRRIRGDHGPVDREHDVRSVPIDAIAMRRAEPVARNRRVDRVSVCCKGTSVKRTALERTEGNPWRRSEIETEADVLPRIAGECCLELHRSSGTIDGIHSRQRGIDS